MYDRSSDKLWTILGQPTVELTGATLEGDTVTVTWSFETAPPVEAVTTDSESSYNVRNLL